MTTSSKVSVFAALQTMFSVRSAQQTAIVLVVLAGAWILAAGQAEGEERGLVAHWPLAGDTLDRTTNELHAKPHAVRLDVPGRDDQPATAAGFDGRGSWLELPLDPRLQFRSRDFSAALWVHTDIHSDDLPGDLISAYDPDTRRGFHLGIKSNCGVPSTQANRRQLQFGIDHDRADEVWTDCGRPGNAILAFALCVHEGNLYAGICDPDKDGKGGVFRYEKPDRWIDCGSPDLSNSVTALAEHADRLYAATGKYRLAGSALPESENPHLGGRVFCYEGENRWRDCGQLPGVEAVGGMVEFRGRLYASSLYKPAGFFRYEGGERWTACAVPDGSRVEALAVYNGFLYASSYDAGRVFRFDGGQWTDCGQLGDPAVNTQTYSFAVRAGTLFAGTWRSGRVYAFENLGHWTDVGQLGQELEVMGMLVHNGRLIAGTLPSAEVYQYERPGSWRRLAILDSTPNVKYRRAWAMAEFEGRVFCSTLPSGKVYSWAAGKTAQSHRAFPVGWHHVAAVRTAETLRLYVDGEMVAESDPFRAADYDFGGGLVPSIGRGPNDFFCGRLSDVRLYDRALDAQEIRDLALADASRP